MPVVLLFLKKYWTYIALAVVVAGGLLYVNGLRMTIAHQQTEIVELKADKKQLETVNGELRSKNESLATSLEKQSKMVNVYVDASDARVAASNAALVKAQAETDRVKKKYAALLTSPPAVTGDDCASTSILLEQYITLRRGELQ